MLTRQEIVYKNNGGFWYQKYGKSIQNWRKSRVHSPIHEFENSGWPDASKFNPWEQEQEHNLPFDEKYSKRSFRFAFFTVIQFFSTDLLIAY